MSTIAQDFEKGLDLSVQPTVNGSDINQIVDAGTPAADKGLVITTTDSGSTPDVPDASADSASPVKRTRWQRYIWRRVRNSGLAPLMYVWNPNATSDATYLKWQAISASASSTGALTFANYAALRAYDFTSLVTGQVTVFVLGYATAGDGGFGEFRLDASDTSSADDDGRVLVATIGSYRFKRVVAPGEFAKPEWFGGIVNVNTLVGGAAISKACRKCVAYYKSLEFGFGIYYTDDKIIVTRDTKIRGQGKRLSTLRLCDASTRVAAYTDGSYFALFMWAAPGTTTNALVGTTYLVLADEGPCDNASVTDLSIYANYDGQLRDGSNRFNCTVRAVELVGGNCRVTRVEAQQCGVGYRGGECFPFRIGGTSGQTNNIGGVIEGCEYSNTGRPLSGGASLATYGWPTNMAGAGRVNGWAGLELTVYALSLSTSGTPSSGALIGNHAENLTRSLSTYPNPINILAQSGSKSCDVSNNTVINCDATCFYSDNTESLTQTTEGLDVHDNSFINVFRGVRLSSGWSTRQYHDCSIHDNLIELYATTPTYNMASPPAGILLDWDFSVTYVNPGDYAFRDITICNNTISGGGNFTPESGTNAFYSRGIYFSFNNGDVWNDFKVYNNRLDVPQYGPASPAYYFQEANSLALYWVGTSAVLGNTLIGSRLPKLLLSGNRAARGDLIPYMTCANGVTVLAEFKQYQHEGVRIRTDDPIDTITNLDDVFPVQQGQLWFNTAEKRLWIAQDTERAVASGSIVEQRSYCVRSDTANTNTAQAKVTYDGIDYAHNAQFLAVNGVSIYTTLGDARVFESPVYCWQALTRDAIQIFQASAATSYDILSDRFIDSAFFVNFNATDTDKVVYLPDPALYPGRSFYLAFAKDATANPREIQLSCKIAGVVTANKIVDPVSCDYVTNLLLGFPRAGLGPSGTAGTSLLGNIALYSNGAAWFVTSQVVDPQEILVQRKGAASGGDFVLTSDATNPQYHNLSIDPNARQLKGLIYLEFAILNDVEFYLPDPANWVGYQFKLAVRVASGKTVTAKCGVSGTPIFLKMINPGVTGIKGEIVSAAVVADVAAANRIIVCEVTAMNGYWLIMCN